MGESSRRTMIGGAALTSPGAAADCNLLSTNPSGRDHSNGGHSSGGHSGGSGQKIIPDVGVNLMPNRYGAGQDAFPDVSAQMLSTRTNPAPTDPCRYYSPR